MKNNTTNKFCYLSSVLVVFGLGTLVSCGPKPLPLIPDSIATDNPEAERAFREARQLFDSGNLKDADRKFSLFIREFPGDPLRRLAELFRGKIAIEMGDPLGAQLMLEPLKKGKDPVSERAVFYDGVALFRIGEYKKSLDCLTAFLGRLTDVKENLLLLDTLWMAAKHLGKNSDAIVWLDEYLSLFPKHARDESKIKELDHLCQMVGDIKSLEKLSDALNPKGVAWPLVMARLARIHVAKGEIPEANKIIEETHEEHRENDQAIQEALVVINQQQTVDIGNVGVIAPLSGRSRLIGEAVVRGVMLAAKSMRSATGMEFTVSIRDSEGKPELAARAVEELVSDEHVSAIIGPLSGAAAAAAAKTAEDIGVPLITLTVRDNLTTDREFVFRQFASNRSEITALVETATRFGLTGFGIFYPNNGYGKSMRRLYESVLRERNLPFVGGVSYTSNGKTFTKETAQLKAIGNMQALYIPDSANQIGLVAPALAAAGLWSSTPGRDPEGPGKAVQLLLPSTGFSMDLIRRAVRYLDGALFAAFFHPRISEAAAQFAELYQAEYGKMPNYIAGFSHDALVLVANAIGSGAEDRGAIRRFLAESSGSKLNGPPLATPFSGFSPQGEPQARPWLLQIQDGEFQVLK